MYESHPETKHYRNERSNAAHKRKSSYQQGWVISMTTEEGRLAFVLTRAGVKIEVKVRLDVGQQTQQRNEGDEVVAN
ncbi:hypothetical protein CFIMG_007255RA00001 [Ceratocystis fimbriata CBS 114723]|uniref:Uncharacterized protein n=1 Tax=Ceratocystis fimbriata CBS 114723 TaxID=1035309 RepID=A0A2C5WYM1_9PEZI|nr:hypothetical protein CFIMG_007255RA00001 [Ceratocystis fimbriata CBS 114723]